MVGQLFAGAWPRMALIASAWLQRRASRSLDIRRAQAGRSSAISSALLRPGYLCPLSVADDARVTGMVTGPCPLIVRR